MLKRYICQWQKYICKTSMLVEYFVFSFLCSFEKGKARNNFSCYIAADLKIQKSTSFQRFLDLYSRFKEKARKRNLHNPEGEELVRKSEGPFLLGTKTAWNHRQVRKAGIPLCIGFKSFYIEPPRTEGR